LQKGRKTIKMQILRQLRDDLMDEEVLGLQRFKGSDV